ncbi:amino acid ABC transporter substrate-binding protein, PAAT family [Marinobacterium lutimaris]|uniref:Amino acid ABC transporter substrate-binding protein, PAAT family n=2 Tax=Marinobacterium lutimaris TaxID=568106 RepID=A0A1H5Z4P9_9GAMM|nr:amino acid ABC transporter substrate-binding protein, PAAT family [Marinobacterium lutimaris]
MKMTKALVKTGLSVLSAGILSQAVSAAPLMTEGDLKVGMEISYPPFESYDGDKVVGFDPEISALLAEKMGATASFHDTKFTGLILGLGANKFDAVISGMYITEDRLKKADAIPYGLTGASILVMKDSEVKPQTAEDLCGVNVGLQQGTAWVSQLQSLSTDYCEANGKEPVEIQEFPTAPEVSQALMSRNVEAQLEIAGAAKMFVERTRGRLEISSPELVYPQTLGMYVKQGNTEMKEALEKALEEIKADGSYAALIEKYELTPVE